MKSMKDIVSRLRLIGDESTEDEAIDEVVLVSTVAIRMAVTNRAVLAMLREKANPDLDWYKSTVREELQSLHDEKLADAKWLTGEIKTAQGRAGRARDSQDFRSVDVKLLRRRKNVVLAVAERLTALGEDDEFLTGEATACQDRTRAEVKEAIETIATRSVYPDPYLTDEEREKRMGDLGRDLMSEISQREKAAREAPDSPANRRGRKKT